MRSILVVWCLLYPFAMFAQAANNTPGDTLLNTQTLAATDTVINVREDSLRLYQDTLAVIGVGDIMMGTNYPEDRLPPDDGRFLMRDVAHILRDADVTFGNLEGTLLDEGGTPKRCRDPKVCYAFRSPVR